MVGNADPTSSADKLRSLQDRTKMLLPKVIHGFKSSVTRQIRKQFNNYEFAWQKSYYDHIIHSDKALEKIREYIYNNPVNWGNDKYYPDLV